METPDPPTGEAAATKSCRSCCMEIPAAARRCPWCRHWQGLWVALSSDIALTGLYTLLAVLVCIGALWFGWRANGAARFSDYADQITVQDIEIRFDGDEVLVHGRVHNDSGIEWQGLVVEAVIRDPDGKLLDGGHDELWGLRKDRSIGAYVWFDKHYPDAMYATCEMRVITATDRRAIFHCGKSW